MAPEKEEKPKILSQDFSQKQEDVCKISEKLKNLEI